MKYNNYKVVFKTVSAIFLLSIFSINTIAGILVTPSRIVFEDNMRSAKVTVVNKGDEKDTFRISFIRQNMDANGEFHPVETNQDGMYSDEIIRYSPRQITLSPGQSQTVRLLLRKKRGMKEGEYRSHLLLQALPKATSSNIKNLSSKTGETISVNISTVLGVSIPVIVRTGNQSSTLELRNVKYVAASDNSPKPEISMEMHRSGNKSTYGDLTAKFITNNGEEIIVGYVKGVAVYANNDMRFFKIRINNTDNLELDNGHFAITYTESTKRSTDSFSQTIKVSL